jgi:hypothetical protein
MFFAPLGRRQANQPASFALANIADHIVFRPCAAAGILAAVVPVKSISAAMFAINPFNGGAAPGALAVPVSAVVRMLSPDDAVMRYAALLNI